MTMKRSYSPNMPSDVREFAQEIARLTASGPVGAEQAARMIAEAKLTEDGRQLVANARHQARISAEMFGLNFSNVKIYSDDNPNQLQRDLQIQATVSTAYCYIEHRRYLSEHHGTRSGYSRADTCCSAGRREGTEDSYLSASRVCTNTSLIEIAPAKIGTRSLVVAPNVIDDIRP